MTSTAADPSLDTTALVDAIIRRDAAALTALYADDAVLTLIDRDHPPAAPMVLTGIEEIGTFLRDICGRNVDHSVPQLTGNDAGVAFEEHCRYPEGNRVISLAVATVAGGKIIRQTTAQAWD